jgi:hypothetical protein
VETRIVLVRHGRTAWKLDYRYQGRSDVPCDEQGLEQTRRAVARLAGWRPRRCSPVPAGPGAWRGADGCVGTGGPVVDPRLTELDFGIGRGSRSRRSRSVTRRPTADGAWLPSTPRLPEGRGRRRSRDASGRSFGRRGWIRFAGAWWWGTATPFASWPLSCFGRPVRLRLADAPGQRFPLRGGPVEGDPFLAFSNDTLHLHSRRTTPPFLASVVLGSPSVAGMLKWGACSGTRKGD